MLPGLSATSSKVMAQAQQVARELGQDFVASEHLLLGLLRVTESSAAAALVRAGVDLRATADSLQRKISGEQQSNVTGPRPLTPAASDVVQTAVKLARVKSAQVSTVLLLLALLDSGTPATLDALRDGGADFDHLRSVLNATESTES